MTKADVWVDTAREVERKLAEAEQDVANLRRLVRAAWKAVRKQRDYERQERGEAVDVPRISLGVVRE